MTSPDEPARGSRPGVPGQPPGPGHRPAEPQPGRGAAPRGATGRPGSRPDAARPGQPDGPVDVGLAGLGLGPDARPERRAEKTGLVGGLLVAPMGRWIARWTVGRGQSPAAFSLVALALSVCAAAWYAAGTHSSLFIGSVLLAIALPVRQTAVSFSPPPAVRWLDAVAGAAGEYAVYAGLAAAWAGRQPHQQSRQAWTFAITAVIVLAVRQMVDACYAAVAGTRPGSTPVPHRWMRLTGQSVALPAGERIAVIAVATPIWGPRAALAVIIGWSIVALGYCLAERAVASRVPGTARGRVSRPSGLMRDEQAG